MSVSPYKRVKVANQGWIGYINISKLDANKAYKMLGIVATQHASYGPGQQATVKGYDKRKWRTQLPGKCLAQLQPGDIDAFKKDISAGKEPLLIFREVMMDKSYRIDIIEITPEVEEKFNSNADIDELETLWLRMGLMLQVVNWRMIGAMEGRSPKRSKPQIFHF